MLNSPEVAMMSGVDDRPVVCGKQGSQTDLMEGDEVTVSFGIDAAFVPHMAAVIASVVAHAPDARFRFLILHTGVDASRRASVETVAPGARFDWVEIDESDVPAFRDRGHFTRAILFRLGLERLAPQDCRRVIYLDADVIVLRDLRELWRKDLGACPIGAVTDTFVYYEDYPAEFAKRWGLIYENGAYVNSGVLLIDLDQVRREGGFSRVISFVAEHGNDLLFADQDAINAVFWGRCCLLGNEWNVSRDRAIAGIAVSLPHSKRLNGLSPAIVHYSHMYKPWRNSGYHPWAWLYWRYLAKTPFTREVASTYGVTFKARMRLWLRWLRRHPSLHSRAASTR
jgi:lipopolysaccharide biosynthesis glycosyltransferase